MPTRCLHSSVLKWPDKATVEQAVRAWAEQNAARRPELLRAGFHGSYARGDWGVGSDVDVVLVVTDGARPSGERSLDWDLLPLPVPADLLVYTSVEWERMQARGGRHARTLAEQTV